ncbi:hypothetical protein OpiT1DRAFT_01597 [Opitutaceae bacterium TAV1]|nr:hypothetical protein OPIT5_18965 [Opitutaceae bacterium TAV5]EIP97166.1 hypothetical protein OpiT1DRAFT_01597 [Opitutaceae bacterium TAV1]
MNMNHTLHKTLFLAATLASLTATATAATVLYSQTFEAYVNPSSGNNQEKKFNEWVTLTNQTGWACYDNSTGLLAAGGTPVVQTGSTIYTSASTKGFTYRYAALDIALADYQDITLSVDTVQTSSTQLSRMRFLIQLDNGNWYASTTLLRPINNSSWTIPEGISPNLGITFTTAKENWSLFTMNTDDAETTDVNEAGVVLTALDADLSGAKITGAGWWVYTASSTVITRFDNFQIAATPIPEPAAAALALAGSAIFLCILIHRCRRPAP